MIQAPTPAPLPNASRSRRGVLAVGGQYLPDGPKGFHDPPVFDQGTTNPHYVDAAAYGVSPSNSGVENNAAMALAIAAAESTGYRRVKLPNSKGGWLDFNGHDLKGAGLGSSGVGAWTLENPIEIFGQGPAATRCRMTGYVEAAYHGPVMGVGYVKDTLHDDGAMLIHRVGGTHDVVLRGMHWEGPPQGTVGGGQLGITMDQANCWGLYSRGGGGKVWLDDVTSSMFVQPYKLSPDYPTYPGLGTQLLETNCFLRYRSNPLHVGYNKHCFGGSFFAPTTNATHVGTGSAVVTMDPGTSGFGTSGSLVVRLLVTQAAASVTDGTGKLKVSLDGGATYGAEQSLPTTGRLVIAGAGGVTAVFAAGTLVLNDTYTFTSLSTGDVSEIIDSTHDWDGNYGVPALLFDLPQSNGHCHAIYVSRGAGLKTRNYKARTNVVAGGGGGVGWLHFSADNSDPAPFSISEGDVMLEGCGGGVLTHPVTPSIIKDVTVEVGASTVGIRLEGPASISGRVVGMHPEALDAAIDENGSAHPTFHDFRLEGTFFNGGIRRVYDSALPWKIGPNVALRPTVPSGAPLSVAFGEMVLDGVELDAQESKGNAAAVFVEGGTLRVRNTHFPTGALGIFAEGVNATAVLEFGQGNIHDDPTSVHTIEGGGFGVIVQGEGTFPLNGSNFGLAFNLSTSPTGVSGNLQPTRGVGPYGYGAPYPDDTLVLGPNHDTVVLGAGGGSFKDVFMAGGVSGSATLTDLLKVFSGRFTLIFNGTWTLAAAGNIDAAAQATYHAGDTLQLHLVTVGGTPKWFKV